jgi:hypothetical protein
MLPKALPPPIRRKQGPAAAPSPISSNNPTTNKALPKTTTRRTHTSKGNRVLTGRRRRVNMASQANSRACTTSRDRRRPEVATIRRTRGVTEAVVVAVAGYLQACVRVWRVVAVWIACSRAVGQKGGEKSTWRCEGRDVRVR